MNLLLLLACQSTSVPVEKTPIDSASPDCATVLYPDRDGDGYGDDVGSIVACEAQVGYSLILGDCDDSDSDVHPNAEEGCDGEDTDCDGLDDTADPDVAALTLYSDGDGDGYGDPSEQLLSCAPVEGYAATGDDCDDADPAIHPNAEEPCDGFIDANCDGVVGRVDTDGDGVVACLDCDDQDATRRPGQFEVCDGLDQDCDAVIDEEAVDAAPFFIDMDGDGHGDTAFSLESCEAPAGYVAPDDDCDDADSSVYPGAPEHCDGLDESCDGVVDEDAVDPQSWYADSDNDGFGGPISAQSCAQPAGFLSDSSDCDDTDAAVFPGASERCDGADEDCDGAIDDNPIDPLTWYFDGDNDGYGATLTTASCAQPVGYAALDSDCDDLDSGVNPGALELCFDAIDEDCDGFTDGCDHAMDAQSELLVLGEVTGNGANGYFGGYITPVGDATGDGAADFWVSATYYDSSSGTDVGRVVLVSGADLLDTNNWQSGSPPTVDIGSAGSVASITGTGTQDYFGATPAACDFDGQGDTLDLLVGASYANNGTTSDTGAVYVFNDRSSGSITASSASRTLYGESSSNRLGASLACPGDLTGDGLVDAAVGAALRDTGGTNSGSVYLFNRNTTSLSNVYEITGENPDDRFGSGVAGGDLNDDGLADLVVGAPQVDVLYSSTDPATNEGAVYVFYGPIQLGTNTSAADADIRILGDAVSSGTGNNGAFAIVQDMDGDGSAELAVGANSYDLPSTNVGAVFLFESSNLPLTGAGLSLSTAQADATILGAPSEQLGARVNDGGDLDGDGLGDLLISASNTDGVGALYLARGAMSGAYTSADLAVRWLGANALDYAGTPGVNLGDLDGDGLDDLGLSAYGYDVSGGSDAGAVYIQLGGAW